MWRAGLGDRAGQRSADLLLHPALEHLAGALLDPAAELLAVEREPHDQRRVARLAVPEAIFDGAQRRAGLGELERADDAAAVVGMHGRSRGRIALRQQLVGPLGSDAVVQALEPLASLGRYSGRKPEIRQRRAQVQTGPADDDRRASGREDLVDSRMRELPGTRRRTPRGRGPRSPRAWRGTGSSGSGGRGRPASSRPRRAPPEFDLRLPRRPRSSRTPSGRRSR